MRWKINSVIMIMRIQFFFLIFNITFEISNQVCCEIEMSTMDTNCPSPASKFTRGEKCIFIHLVLTFVFILVSALIYFIHVYLVEHPGNSYLKTRRFSQYRPDGKDVTVPDYLPIGILYLNVSSGRSICNTIHLRETWSIAPAHCVIIRTDPGMVQSLLKWTIEYRTVEFKYVVTSIKRSIIHPQFNRDDFSNNIGLLEHTDSISMQKYIPFDQTCHKKNIMDQQNLQIIEWITPKYQDIRRNHLTLHSVNRLDWIQCNNYMAPVVDIRTYEYCLTLPKGDTVNLNHGAALLAGHNVVGFFTWGERRGRTLPFIILHIADFKDWIQNTTTLADTFQ